MERGSEVQVRDALGAVLRRRVVATTAEHVYVCTDEEYRAATSEGREPTDVGFRRSAVVSD